MKQILRSLCTLLMLVVWASGFAQEVTLDFTNSKTWNLPLGSDNKETTEKTYSNGTYSITINASDGHYLIGNKEDCYSLFFGQKNATLTLPAFDFDVEKIVLKKTTQTGSGNTTQNIYVGSTAVSTETRGVNNDQTYQINAEYQAAGNIYVLKVTNGNNTQFSKIEIYKKASTKTLKSLAISGEPTKKAYNDGDAFDPTGLVVTGTYNDNTTATITNGITWKKTPATLAVGTTSCSVTATVNGVTSPAYEVTGLSVTKAITLSIDPATSTVVKAPVKVSLTATHGATIYYTLNGDEPTTTSTKYTAPFEVTKSGTTVKALAVADGIENATAEATYTIEPEQPVFSDESKTFSDAFDVTLSLPASTDATSKIYYAIGKTATAESSLYNGPINISAEKDGDKVILHAVVVDQFGNVGKEKYCTYTKTTAVVFDFTANPNAWGITPQKNNGKYGSNVVAGKELKVSGVVMTATNGSQYGTCLYGTTSVTLNVYKGGSITFTAPEGYNISEITFDKTNLLEADKGTFSNGTWTGNAHAVKFSNSGSKIGIKNATIKLVATSLDLSESETAEEISKKLTESNSKTIDVKLARTLTAGKWNTICLPFDVTLKQMAEVLNSTVSVKEYGDENADTQTIYFNDATTMVAGKPYLIKLPEGATIPTVLEFKGVTIKNVEDDNRKFGSNYKICGTFGKYTMKTDGTELFLKTDGKFYIPAAGTATMKGFRAYFIAPKNTAGAALNLSFGEATGIDGVAADAVKSVKIYNVNGQYVGTSLDALPKGLYIVGGKKVLK